ncbi:MAG: YitT family protein [Salinivirgaceae bacterium]|nr:YitT family protein [Salinivirgaceae bacterium]
MKTQINIWPHIKSYAITTFGLFIHALGWTAFLIPGEIVGGGISGVAAAVFYATGIPAGYPYLAINAVLIIVAIKMLGASFGIKTIYSVIMVSFFLTLQQKFITAPIISEGFMSTVLGGLLGGAGVGIVFTQGGSTGGTDVIAMIINKYRNVSPGKVILYCDIIIIGSSYFLFQSMEKLVYGFVTMGVVAYTIDLVLNGSKQSIQIMIFSQKYDEIAEKINAQIHRGITLLDGEGWHTKKHIKVIVTIVRKNEAPMVHSIVNAIDPKAFISQGQVMGVFGEGFEKIRG